MAYDRGSGKRGKTIKYRRVVKTCGGYTAQITVAKCHSFLHSSELMQLVRPS